MKDEELDSTAGSAAESVRISSGYGAAAFDSANRRRLILSKGRERAISNRHPWIFSGSIEREEGAQNAAVADLFDNRGAFVASGFYSMHSQIRLRALTFDKPLEAATLEQRLRDAVARRAHLLTDGSTTAARMIHSEGDDLSGLIVDRFGDVAVVEITSAGLDRLAGWILPILSELLGARTLLIKNSLSARRKEQLSQEDRLEGEPREEVEILENHLRFVVSLKGAQKTGFFLDQRDNRQLVRNEARGKSVLNLFCYSGAFGVYAAAGGATEISEVDISAPALELARRNHALNQSTKVSFTAADVFEYLRERASAGTRDDLVICDPPAFAKSKGDIDRAARGYKDINLFAMKSVKSGGRMLTFSCSGHLSPETFQQIVLASAIDAGRRVSIVRRLGAGSDHPVSIFCHESEYLKGLMLQFLD